ncbi:thyroglobulin [Osmerus mordax]|uniref:thyroglobulin n=1 Tax=Osmerus mordax TaxID=8014 RepID=UPI00350FF849
MEKIGLMCFSCLLLCGPHQAQGKISEYQIESESLSRCESLRGVAVAGQHNHIPHCFEDGRFRQVQCRAGGEECWCVSPDGEEIPGSRTTGSPVTCLTSCQLQRQRAQLEGAGAAGPQCQASGEFQPVQCAPARGQCWCVDLDGMELYGTRQDGSPALCPGSCEVRARRVLHGSRGRSPPQCSEQGSFLPVQCQFVNMTDMQVFDLLANFNRFPEDFQTFSRFRRSFPEVSSFCSCSDSRGREIPSTGVELLLDEVYDTVFSGPVLGRSFSQTNMYRILSRRFLALLTALTGSFRCPTPCDRERSAALQSSSVFVPSCDAAGAYLPGQCQAGGQCWCVDPSGREVYGTRQQGTPPDCAAESDCPSARRVALSRLLSGPQAPAASSQQTEASPGGEPAHLAPCSPRLQQLQQALWASLPEEHPASLASSLPQLLQGLFPSGALALRALSASLSASPRRLQENLFGGKFLKSTAAFNFSGTVGPRGTLGLSSVFSQVGLTQNQEDLFLLAQTLSSSSSSSAHQINLDQNISDPFGRTVNLRQNQQLLLLLSQILETRSFQSALTQALTQTRAESPSEWTQLLSALLPGPQPPACPPASPSPYVPSCTPGGQYQERQCLGRECWCVDEQGREMEGSRSQDRSSRCPSRCERERAAALRARASQPAGVDSFIPKCREDGGYVALQCVGQTCFCVDAAGQRQSPVTAGETLQCPSACQTRASQLFMQQVSSALRDPAAVSDLSAFYVPRCAPDGTWLLVQCDGPPEQAFQFYQEWTNQNSAGRELPVSELLAILRAYGNSSSAMASFGGFLEELYAAGHQRVFPGLRAFPQLGDLPREVLEGRGGALRGPGGLLDPLAVWELLRGQGGPYPGSLADFSLPLQHLDLRRCWCVSQAGEEIPGTKALANQVPACPGSCAVVQREVEDFLEGAEQIISISNSSHFPLGAGFLLAEGLRLTQEESLHALSPGEELLYDRLMSHSKAALQLAAHSTLQFSWQSQQGVSEDRAVLRLGYQPYSPQCDARGDWLPTQCHTSTGQCWCVDKEGEYIPGSLTSRPLKPLQCQTPCQRAAAQALLSDWTPSVSDITTPASYSPSCDAAGQFSVLQRGGLDQAWCVTPETGDTLQPADPIPTGELTCPSLCLLLRGAAGRRQVGLGYQPECRADGSFSPSQCDVTHCWCVSSDGRELVGTRSTRGTGARPHCDSPQCPSPFPADASISQGALLCRSQALGGQQRQSCDLTCHHGYDSALPVKRFLCDVDTQTWLEDAPLPQACQKVQVYQTVQSSVLVQLSLAESAQPCSSSSLQASLLTDMRAQGLCSLQLSPSGSSVSVCEEGSVRVECVSEGGVTLEVVWRVSLLDLPVAVLPDLHDIDVALGEARLQAGLMGLLGRAPYRSIVTSDPQVIFTLPPTFGCSLGYQPGTAGTGCVLCPAGAFSSGGVCRPCPPGSYQEEGGQDFCSPCPRDSTTAAAGASSKKHCMTECQRKGLQCSERGDFLLAQKDFLSGRWVCVTAGGAELAWTNREEPLSEDECKVLGGFEDVPTSRLILEAEDSHLIRSQSSNTTLEKHLHTCLQACAQEQGCLHLAVSSAGGQAHCELYSQKPSNLHCNTSDQTRGFLGNPEAAMFKRLRCYLRVRGGAKGDLLVLRKKGQEVTVQSGFERMPFRKLTSGVYRTVVFPAEGASVTDAHRFCQDACSSDSCCEGFLLNANILDGGSIMCGLVRSPSVLQCSEGDWDVSGLASSARVCGAGLTYDQDHKSFIFNFGGQNFVITDAALPASSKNKSDYQASIIIFQAIYLHTGVSNSTDVSSTCVGGQPTPDPPAVVSESFERLEVSEILVEPDRNVPHLLYFISKHTFSPHSALLWCQTRCQEEEQCSVLDVRSEGDRFYSCSLYPDPRVCGGYDTPLRQPCLPRLPQPLHNPHIKKVDLSGGVKSFYRRVSFRKMVSYSVRSRVSLSANTLTDSFMECERRCDEDPCCRGIGYVRDRKSPGVEVLCLTLVSLGIQTCREEEEGEGGSSWRVQNCSPSGVDTSVEPYGWYEKPVNQWTKSPALCPKFELRAPSINVSMEGWRLLGASSVLVDPSLSTYDVLHLSQDISEDLQRTTAWCLSACEEAESCAVVTVRRAESAVRCVLYPDTRTCGPAPQARHCRLVVRETAPLVYLRVPNPARASAATSVFIPGHGMLLGVARTTALGSDRKTVIQFLGVPYARPPIGARRFSAPEPAVWSGTWNATVPRASCLQPGDLETSASSEDCLYLNIFVPSGIKGSTAVLVFFYNPSSPANHSSPGLLDASHLAAVGNVVVVTAHTRVAALGFLRIGSALPGNSGLQDQRAALLWVQDHVARLGGDPRRVTVGAERGGADVTSLHLLSSQTPPLFQRMLLMGGSVFSPSLLLGDAEARRQALALARQLDCPTSDPNPLMFCLRGVPARVLNAAQTKLLAVSGPLQAWSPVVDGLQEAAGPQGALQSSGPHSVDLLLGSSAHDGLISRARNIKNFEQLQGRADSKTAFYQALSESLGGREASALVKEAATWFYSLQHSPTPAGYNLFSQALNNATRDLFIVCPIVKMAAIWAANSRSKVFQYHIPESSAQTSGPAFVPLDVQYMFGVPHHPASAHSFTSSERQLSLQITSYIANFIHSGDPNQAHPASLAPPSPALPPWPRVLPLPGGALYKELAAGLRDLQGLHREACSFWTDYIPALSSATAKLSGDGLASSPPPPPPPPPPPRPPRPALTEQESSLPAPRTSSPPKTEKDAYS